MARFNLIVWRCTGRRVQGLVFLLAAAYTAVFLTRSWWLVTGTSSALMPPPPLIHDLQHLRRERNLKRELLIEPSSTPCESVEPVPLLVLVSTSPENLSARMAVRGTWGRQLTTYFVLGLDQSDNDDQLSDVYLEAKQFSDMVVYDLVENYQNLTLKSALMLQWTLRRCPQAQALFKTDDDVLVNPWLMKTVVKEHEDHHLFGYRRNQTAVHRDQYTKWYMPRWLFYEDTIPEYLSGTGYIINGEYIERILKAAYTVPLINLEDIFFTYLVAKNKLQLTLTHERRVSPFKPWIRSGCALWGLAAVHSLGPEEMNSAWARLSPLGKKFEGGEEVCGILGFLSSNFFLY